MSLRAWLKRLTARARDGARDVEDYDEGDVAQSADTFDEEVDPFDPFPAPVRLEITDVFDLHTVAPRDVRRAVEAYLDEAHRLGFRSVRLIHGKGRGVQRANVRAVLARTPLVLDWTDAPPAAGGQGATIAHLRPPE